MSSNLRVNSIVPATGTNVAIGTAGGSITFNANVSGVSTFTTLNATSITVAAGSTSSPSISPSGDSNTGIFFPSADTIAFGEGGVEALRINSSANIGIGTDNPQAPFGGRALHLGNTSDSRSILTLQSSNTGRNSIYFSDGTTGGDTYRGYIDYIHSDNIMTFGVETSERMRIDSSGRVTAPYQPSFFAYATGNDTTTADNTIIIFGGTAHNTGGHYSTSTGRFTAPVTGVYAFHAQIWAKNGTGYSRAIFTVAGTQVTQNGFHPNTVSNSNDHSFQMSMVRSVSAGDAVDIRVNLGPLTYYGGGDQSHTYFTGYLVG